MTVRLSRLVKSVTDCDQVDFMGLNTPTSRAAIHVSDVVGVEVGVPDCLLLTAGLHRIHGNYAHLQLGGLETPHLAMV